MKPLCNHTGCGRLIGGLLLGASFATVPWVEGQTPTSPPSAPGQPVSANPQPTPSQVTDRLIADARASFARVRDYVGLFYKQERVGGQLLPEQTIQVRVRQQPFSVHMKWVAPQKMIGQEACYVEGRNNNQLRAKSAGALMGAIGFISIDPRDPKAMTGNRHAINEAGLGNLIESIAQGQDASRRLPPDKAKTIFGEYRFLNRTVTRMESIYRVNSGQFYCHRVVVYFDKETRLPVRFEAYDWPQPGGSPTGELLECYSYVDLKFNVGLTDANFNY